VGHKWSAEADHRPGRRARCRSGTAPHMSAAFLRGSVRVRVPATSANLGPGFDALGLALELRDEITARVTSDGLQVDVLGEGAHDVPSDASHLVVRAMHAAFDELGARPPGIALSCTNAIPHARGLGSSAAAIVAGVLAARALVDDGARRMPDDAALRLACRIEGHPDNVAACLLGGLTIAWTDDGAARALRVPTTGIRPLALIPSAQSSTAHVRGLLPPTVRHAEAAFAAGRSALLVAALSGAPDVLLAATEDSLHQHYRAPAMPETADLVQRLRGSGLAAVVSGAGPTVLVLARDDAEVEQAVAAVPDRWRPSVLSVAPRGGHQVAAGH
jgi:homoserine kinase